MTVAGFFTAWRIVVDQTPFHAYRLELTNGEMIEVRHPEALIYKNAVITFLELNNSCRYFDPDSVVQIFEGTP